MKYTLPFDSNEQPSYIGWRSRIWWGNKFKL